MFDFELLYEFQWHLSVFSTFSHFIWFCPSLNQYSVNSGFELTCVLFFSLFLSSFLVLFGYKIYFKLRPYNLAVINVGAPSCGVNSCLRSFVRHGIGKGCKIYAVLDGFDGLVNGQVS